MVKIALLTALAAAMAGVTAVIRFRRFWNKDRYLILKGRELNEAIEKEKDRLSAYALLEDVERGEVD